MVKIKARFRPDTRLIDLHLKNNSIGPVPARDNTKVHLHQNCPWQVELRVTDVSTGKELNSNSQLRFILCLTWKPFCVNCGQHCRRWTEEK